MIQQQVFDENFINSILQSVDFTNEQINNGSAKLDTLQTHYVFHIHNEIAFPKNKEWSKSCAPCRLRVYKRVMQWYNEQPWKTFTPKCLS